MKIRKEWLRREHELCWIRTWPSLHCLRNRCTVILETQGTKDNRHTRACGPQIILIKLRCKLYKLRRFARNDLLQSERSLIWIRTRPDLYRRRTAPKRISSHAHVVIVIERFFFGGGENLKFRYAKNLIKRILDACITLYKFIYFLTYSKLPHKTNGWGQLYKIWGFDTEC